MRVLYKDFSDGYLSVAEVTGTTYYEEEQVLEFIGSDRDFAIQADERLAEKLVRDLYENGRLDVTAYEPAELRHGHGNAGGCRSAGGRRRFRR